MKTLKTLLSIVLCVLLLIPTVALAADGDDVTEPVTEPAAAAPEITIDSEVLPAGRRASSMVLTFAEELAPIEAEKLTMVTINARGRETAVAITSEISGSKLIVSFPSRDPSTNFRLSYDGNIMSTADTVLAESPNYTMDDVTKINTAIVDDFIEGAYTGYYFDAEGELQEITIPYRLFIPENAGEEALPLVFTLHGSGEVGTNNIAHVTASQIATCWATDEWQEENPCYVLAPQWPNADWSRDPYMVDVCINLMYEIVKETIANYNVDTQRVYAATLSMGSRMITRFLELYPELFVAALVCCGNADAADLSSLTEPAVWFLHAEHDPVNKVQGSIDAYNTMVEAGNEHVYLTIFTREQMTGLNGHASWQLVYGKEEYMNWLFSWVAEGPSVSAPESVKVGEQFDIQLKTDKDYAAVKLVNESGNKISVKNLSVRNGEFLNTWTIATSIGTARPGRVITVLAKAIGGEYEEVGTVTLDVEAVTETTGAKAQVKKAVFSKEKVHPNVELEAAVTTNSIAAQVRILNENGSSMGKKLVYVTNNGATREFGYTMSIGTSGSRVFTFAAAKEDGVYNYKDIALAAINVI